MLTKDEMFVQGERIASDRRHPGDAGRSIIGPLRAALKRPTLVGQATTEKRPAEREITVMG